MVLLRLVRLAAAVAGVALTASCGAGGSSPSMSADSPSAVARPSTTAGLDIRSPEEGQRVEGPNVRLVISLRGARIVERASTALRADEGHLHVLLDGRIVTMTSGQRLRLRDVGRGAHLVRVEFVASDHGPFDPPLYREVSFEVM